MDQDGSLIDDLAGIVHDLRHPLAVVSGYADFLSDGSLGHLPDPARAAVEAIVVKSAEMAALLDAMLELSGRRASDPPTETPAIDLRHVVRDAVSRARPRVAYSGDRIELASSSDPLPIRAPAAVMGRILDNLINNAITHGRQPGQIHLSTTQSDGHAELRIEDDGPGLPETVRRKHFPVEGDPDSAATVANRGGLGLMLSLSLTRRLGGTVRMGTPAMGGTALILSFPLAP